MNDYRISEYGVPGLADVGTLRLPVASAPVAEQWITGQGGRILSNAPIRSGGQVIRFEDPAYQSLIGRLAKKAHYSNHDHFFEVADRPTRDFEMSREGYESLQNLKAKNAPLDFLDRIVEAPDRNWDVGIPSYPADTGQRLRAGYQKIGIPVEIIDQDQLKTRWLDNEGGRLSDYEQQVTQPKYVFDPYEGKQGTMFLPAKQSTGFENLHNRSLIQGLADRLIGGTDSLVDLGMAPQVVVGTGAQDYALGSGSRVQGIHDAATQFAIEKQLVQDPRALKDSFDRMMNHIKYANPDYASYVAQPEFRNQIRTAGRFAGSLFA